MNAPLPDSMRTQRPGTVRGVAGLGTTRLPPDSPPSRPRHPLRGGRVGLVNDDGHHSTFRLALEPGTDVGKQSKMGLIAVGNDKGQVRLCLPWSWRNFVTAAGFEVTQGQDENEKPVAMIWQDPKPGDGFAIPLPVGRAAGLKLAVKVV